MLRRTFVSLVAVAAALRKRLHGQSRGELTRMADRQLAATPFKSDEIMRLGTEGLVAILNDSGSSEFAKAKACQRLAIVGDESAVPALASLLSDPRLSHYARTALEPLPGSAADRALREALGRLDGASLVGVINSIGVRRDPEALDALAALRNGDDAEVAKAASSAIGQIRRP